MRIGIIGVKYTGKTTLFNAITGQSLPTGQGGVEPHRAVAQVPDPRLDHLTEIFRPRRTVPAQVEWVDIPGFQLDAAAGGREGTRFLEHGRRVEALALVVRCFDAGLGAPRPGGEMEAVDTELALADLQVVENRRERLARDRQKMGRLANPGEAELLARFQAHLEQGRPLREMALTPEESKLISGFGFLTIKPLLTVLNGPEEGVPASVSALATARGGETLELCAKLEEEIAQLAPAERLEFLAGMGIAEPALHRMIRASYRALGLRSFFTVGEDECRAWTLRAGALAPEAAGVVHSDMERGFIRAEVCTFEDLAAAGSLAAVRKNNRLRLEGKAYEVQDGDVLSIRFSV